MKKLSLALLAAHPSLQPQRSLPTSLPARAPVRPATDAEGKARRRGAAPPAVVVGSGRKRCLTDAPRLFDRRFSNVRWPDVAAVFPPSPAVKAGANCPDVWLFSNTGVRPRVFSNAATPTP